MPLTTFLNGGTVTYLRGLAWLALSDLGQVGAGTVTSDGGGGGTTTWNYGSTIACRVDPIVSNEGIVGGRIDDRSTHLITAPPDTAVTHNNRFAVIGGGTFEVTGVQDRTGDPLTFFEAFQVL